MRTRTRRLLFFVLLLGLCGGGALAALAVIQKGRGSQNPYERGLQAERRGDFKAAEDLYRGLLETKPDHLQAFGRLVAVLRRQGDFEAIEEAARARCEAAPGLPDGWATRVTAAIAAGRFQEAERIARSRSVTDPLLLHFTLWQIQDISDNPRQRLAAAESALRYAQLANAPEGRAAAELFAARTLRDISDASTGDAVAPIRERADQLVAEGASRLERSMQTTPTAPGRVLLLRFQLLDPKPAVRENAASDLERWLKSESGNPQADDVRRELVRHYLRAARAPGEDGQANSRSEFIERARRIAAPLADEPAYRLFRILRSFALANASAEALELIRSRKSGANDDLVELERCRLMLETQAEPGAAVVERALELMSRARDWRVAVLAHDIVSAAGEPGRALEALDAYQREHPAPQLALDIANRLLRDDGQTDEALQLVEDTVGGGENAALLGPAIAVLDRAGPEHVFAFLQKRIDARDDQELRYRLTRVIYVMQRSRRDDAAEPTDPDWIGLARGDFARSLELSDQAKPGTWQLAARLALALKEYGFGGRFAARLIAESKTDLGRSLVIFAAAAAAKDAEARREFLEELGKGVAGTPDAEWCVPLIDSVLRDRKTLGDLLDAVQAQAPVEKANVRTLEIVCALGVAGRQAELVERAARRLLEQDASHPAGCAVLADVLMRRGEYAAVLAVYERAGFPQSELPPVGHDQCIRALIGLDRVDEAVQRAQAYFEGNLQERRAYSALAVALNAAGEKEKALGVLTAGPPSVEILLPRAALLFELGRADAAERILRALCANRPDLVVGWEMLLLDVLAPQNRGSELILPLTQALDAPAVRARPAVRIALRVLRGMANEQASRASAAIEDYLAAIAAGERGLVALNNAAWLIHQNDPSRLDKARELIEMALDAAPGQPNVNDTAAHIYLDLGMHDKALASIRVAVEAHKDNWSYRLTQARIHAAAGDRESALRVLDLVRKGEPSSELAHDAEELRKRIAEAAPESD